MMGKIAILFFVAVVSGSLSACSDLPQVRVLRDPLTPEEHVLLGLAYEMEGRTAFAAQEFNVALRQNPGYRPALIGLGNLAFDKGALDEAEAYYRQALATAPEDPGANNNLAMLYLRKRENLDENLDEAERLAGLALAQGGPLQPYVLDTMAHIYVRQGRYREAHTALQNAEALTPASDKILHERLARSRQALTASRPDVEQELEGEL
jgi:tetratricopeptide (TPR) repeat protein